MGHPIDQDAIKSDGQGGDKREDARAFRPQKCEPEE